MKIVIAGAGEMGFFLAKELSETTHTVLLVDLDEHAIQEAEELLDVMTIVGDIKHRQVMSELSCQETDLFLAVTGDDPTNLLAASWAKRLGAKVSIARFDDPHYYPDESHIVNDDFQINAIVCTSRILGLDILRKILCVEAHSVYEFAGYGISAMHLKIKESSPFHGVNVKHLDVPVGCHIRAVVRGNLFRGIETVSKLMADDEIVVVGRVYDLFAFLLQDPNRTRDRKALIIGGGDVGLQVAKDLERFEEKIELIERDKKRCLKLAESLEKTRVIHGSGSDIGLLNELQLNSGDYVATLTGRDEVNIMCCLIAKEVGVGHAFARLNLSGYDDVVEHLAVDDTSYTHDAFLSLTKSFLDMTTTIKYVSTSYSHDYFELRVTGLTKKDLNFLSLELPALVMIIGAVRNFKPLDLGSTIKEGDHIVFAGPRNTAKQTVKTLRGICRN